MARLVVLRVGLDLDDPATDAVDEERPADEGGRGVVDAAGHELGEGHSRASKSCGCRVSAPRRERRRPTGPASVLSSISSRIVSCVREATIGSGIPSTQTSVRRPLPRSSPDDRLERVDPVGPHVLAEAEEHHAVRHGRSIA